MEGFDVSSLFGTPPSEWSSLLAGQGVDPSVLQAHADAAPMGGATPSPWEPTTGSPAGPPMQADGSGMLPGPAMPTGSPAGPPVQAGETPEAAAAKPPATPGGGPALVNALRGMVAPTVVQPQRVSSPSVPRPPSAMPGGQLTQLLGQLGMLRGAQMPTAYNLPSTLGAALGGGGR